MAALRIRAGRNLGVDEVIGSEWKTGEYSDLTIRCGPVNEFKVHKIIVCTQSKYFANAVKEGKFKEGETGIIDFPVQDHPKAVKAVIEFLYTGNYEVPANDCETSSLLPFDNSPSTKRKGLSDEYRLFNHTRLKNGRAPSDIVPSYTSAMMNTIDLAEEAMHPTLFHLKVYELSDRINLLCLKMMAEQNFEREIAKSWRDSSFPNAVQTVYEITPPGFQGDRLREIVLKVAAANLNALFEKEEFVDLVGEVPEIGSDLSQVLCGFRKIDYGKLEFKCSPCGFTFEARPESSVKSLRCPSCSTVIAVRKGTNDPGKEHLRIQSEPA